MPSKPSIGRNGSFVLVAPDGKSPGPLQMKRLTPRTHTLDTEKTITFAFDFDPDTTVPCRLFNSGKLKLNPRKRDLARYPILSAELQGELTPAPRMADDAINTGAASKNGSNITPTNQVYLENWCSPPVLHPHQKTQIATDRENLPMQVMLPSL